MAAALYHIGTRPSMHSQYTEQKMPGSTERRARHLLFCVPVFRLGERARSSCVRLFCGNHLDIEDQISVSWNRSSTLGAIAERGGNIKAANSTRLHASHPFNPALNHLTLSKLESSRRRRLSLTGLRIVVAII